MYANLIQIQAKLSEKGHDKAYILQKSYIMMSLSSILPHEQLLTTYNACFKSRESLEHMPSCQKPEFRKKMADKVCNYVGMFSLE
jgi:hypothetical protein